MKSHLKQTAANLKTETPSTGRPARGPRRAAVDDHMTFRESIARPSFDVIDVAADPILDRLPAIRGKDETQRVLRILDSLPIGTDAERREYE